MAGYASPLAVPLPRGGAVHWVRSYQTLIRWHLAGLRMWLALLATIQILAGAGFIFGIALFFRHIPPTAALFVCTGVPVINLVMVGLILGPQLVAEQKLKGSYDFIRSLPVPRTAAAGAWYTVCLLAGLPAVAVSLVLVTDLVPCYLVLLGWLAAGWLMTAWVLGRRR